MSYKILPYSYKRARKLGVTIKPSRTKGKKIDVYKGQKKIASPQTKTTTIDADTNGILFPVKTFKIGHRNLG